MKFQIGQLVQHRDRRQAGWDLPTSRGIIVDAVGGAHPILKIKWLVVRRGTTDGWFPAKCIASLGE